MLKPKATSTPATNGNGDGTKRLPKASDFKLPKKLDKKTIRLIETTEVILEGFRKAREKEQTSEK